MTSGSFSALWDFYGDAFRLHTHQLLAWAYADVRSKLTTDMEEPDITGLFADAIWFRLNHHPSTPDTYLHYSVGDQQPVSPQGQLGNDRLRLDITIIRTGIRPRLSFILEAKRLRTGGFPIGKYVGDGGIGDFIACRYGADYPEAAMVALLQNKDIPHWHGELRRVFSEDQSSTSPRLGITQSLSPVSVLGELPDELVSMHERSNGISLRLFHIFLDCTTVP